MKLTDEQKTRLMDATPERFRDLWSGSDVVQAFVLEALASANDDGDVLPPANMAALSVYQHMVLAGFLDRPNGIHKPGPYRITDAGRRALDGVSDDR